MSNENKQGLTVWYGSIPESNGKANWTAILKRAGNALFNGPNHTIAQSEYPDRVKYEADRVRHIIGELDKAPEILDYDADLHSGYTGPQPTPDVAARSLSIENIIADWRDWVFRYSRYLPFEVSVHAQEEFSNIVHGLNCSVEHKPAPDVAQPVIYAHGDHFDVDDCAGLAPNAKAVEPFGYFKSSPFGWESCKKSDECAIALYEAAPDVEALQARLTRAESALTSAGWTYKEGTEAWKPPLGPSASPLLDRIAELEAQQGVLVDTISALREAFVDAAGSTSPFAKPVLEVVDEALAAVKPASAPDVCIHGIRAPHECAACLRQPSDEEIASFMNSVKPAGQERGAS